MVVGGGAGGEFKGFMPDGANEASGPSRVASPVRPDALVGSVFIASIVGIMVQVAFGWTDPT